MGLSAGLWRRLTSAARDLPPDAFAVVMATGVVSIDLDQQRLRALALALFILNALIYLGLALLAALRVALFARRIGLDAIDHRRAPGFFTLVAATCVLAGQWLALADALAWATVLWWVGLALWALVTYGVFAALTVATRKPTLREGVTGAWLLAIVATQAVALVGGLIAARLPSADRLGLDFLALALWLWGVMFYVWIIVLIFYRYMFFELPPAELSPPYWINMGAMAISALTGATLVQGAAGSPFLRPLSPFLEGLTVLCWASAAWWIPALVALGVWRHTIGRFPLRYDASYWAGVFPLGMFGACTFEMARALNLSMLDIVPRVFTLAAALAWCATLAGLAGSLAKRTCAQATPPQ